MASFEATILIMGLYFKKNASGNKYVDCKIRTKTFTTIAPGYDVNTSPLHAII